MFDLSFTVQTGDGQVTRREVTLPAPPDRRTVDDAVEVLWAMQRLFGPCVLLSLRVVEMETALTHRLEVETNPGTTVTPALRLSSMALVWLQGAAFELPRHPRAH